ncbi:AAA family ATPase [Lysinibacillus sp. G4S2]|uniref:AAA family ATPase n=1 Tax=Lysinibacillus sp. G4S2 TaxID=3055859 RepID=UPI0025A12968|nr:AAA family ATPase [Lysinibacillus sp. G4S2]MDM5246333.1 AAA family ATPase [Lysinibacillus sp. G4S2]
MKVLIENLALIKDSKFSDAQFNVVVGNNGSGKTIFLETIVYIKKALGQLLKKKISDTEILKKLIKLYWDDKAIVSKLLNTPFTVFERSRFEGECSFELQYKLLDAFLKDTLSDFNKSINTEILVNILGGNSNKKSHGMRLEVTEVDYLKIDKVQFAISKVDDTQVRLDVFNGFQKEFKLFSIVKEMEYDVDQSEAVNQIDEENTFTFRPVLFGVEEIEEQLKDYINECIIKLIINDVVYSDIAFFPTERSSFYDKGIVKMIVHNPEDVDIRYSEKLFYKSYDNFKDFTKRFRLPSIRNSKVLSEMVDGDYIYDDDGEIVGFKQKDGIEVPKRLFSTKQNRMMPYLMLENPLERFELVVIEEPEAHLSISSMRKLIPFFENIIKNKKQKLIISTHSEILLQLLNNTLLLDEDISSNVYELINLEDGRTNLKEAEKTPFGYRVKLMTQGLEKLFEESNKIHSKILEDMDDDI